MPNCLLWRQGLAAQTIWVLGFLSAFNYYQSNTGDFSNGFDSNGIFAWIDNYCLAHPLDSIATATIELITEVSNRAGAQQ